MYGYFSFTIRRSRSQEDVLCIFCATASPTPDAIKIVIRRHCESSISPDRVLLLGIDSERERLEGILEAPALMDWLRQFIRNIEPPPINVGLIPRQGFALDQRVSTLEWQEIQRSGMAAIFRARKALLIAPPTHHFRKPSTRHSDRFIRTANALVDGAEITFIAACCLRFIPQDIQHYYCDTGGISVLAFAIDSLRRRFNRELISATVNTFESYEGLRLFDFREPENSIVLISASTSCGLEDLICQQERRFRPEQLVTIYSMGVRERFSGVICDIEKDPELRQEVGDWKSYSDAQCPLCSAGSIAVPMLGDQFIPVRSETRSVLIVKDHAPRFLSRSLETFAGCECLRAFYRSANSFHATNDVFVDIERLIRHPELSDKFADRLNRLVEQSVPAATRRIIHLDDPASQCLAERIAQSLRRQRGEERPLLVLAASSNAAQEQMAEGACVVVAAAVASGHSILAISQRLREIQRNNVVSYFIALARMPGGGDVDKLEKDIRMGEVAGDYGFAICERVNLPLGGRNSTCSWDEELEFFQELSNVEVGDVRGIMEARVAQLRNALSEDNKGMANGLFWNTHEGRFLTLRDNYVFLPRSIRAQQMSQGDVYFSISSILHHLRNSGSSPLLRQSEYERRVISPLCFDRFNDGVIQASIVRAAIRPELSFLNAPELSRQMGAILRAIFGASKVEKGEASREMLLAICLRRLVLAKVDLAELYGEFSRCDDPLMGRMWGFVNDNILA